MKHVTLALILSLILLTGCVNKEKLKQEIKQELKEELKTEIIQDLENSNRLASTQVHISGDDQDRTDKEGEEVEEWQVDYKTIQHKDFTRLEFALPNDPGHSVTISLEFRYHRKMQRVFGKIMSNKDEIITGIGEIMSEMKRDDFSDPLTRERFLPRRILRLVNRYMDRGEISEVVITELSTK